MALTNHRRFFLGWLPLLFVLVLLGVLASLFFGSNPIALSQVWQTLTGDSAVPDSVKSIVLDERGRRTLLGLVVGAALGISGVMAQTQTRNALADPGLLGVSAGAACAVALTIYTIRPEGQMPLMWAGLIGAALASLVVFSVASSRATVGDPLTLILAGQGMHMSLLGVTAALVLLDRGTFTQMRFWQAGSLAGREDDALHALLPFVAVGIVLALLIAPAINALAMGSDYASSVGIPVSAVRFVGIAAITILTGAATAACGPIAFLGLATPHIARKMVGTDMRKLIPTCALLGMALLLVADTAGRVAGRPGELEASLTLAIFGAPLFIMVVRNRRSLAV